MSVAGNFLCIQRRIAAAAARAGRDPAAVTVVAVTKTVTPAAAGEALAAGLRDLGENRVQEGLAKQEVLGREAAVWHLIGSLQGNKARRAVAAFDLIHSLDRPELAQILQAEAERLGRRVSVLVQVNVSGEASKHGLPPGELLPFLAGLRACSHLRPCGLMTMAPLAAEAEAARPVFRGLRELFGQAARELAMDADWRWLSMGMSQDFEIAVEEGANLVRIGTALFGPRT